MQRFFWMWLVCLAVLCGGMAAAQETAAPAPTPAPTVPVPATVHETALEAAAMSVPPVAEPLTLMSMVEQGGAILWVIMGLGFLALVWALYLLLTLTPGREVPKKLIKRAQAQIASGDLRGAYKMCAERDELLANVLAAGLKMAGHDRFVIQEAMESEGARGAAKLWQRITYLNNIGTLTPLLGLFGTVWGMMQAFTVISADLAQVQGMTMAAGVAKAMITTAGGLAVAIPAMTIYFYLRGRVTRIIAVLEAQGNEFIELILEHGPRK